VHNLYYLNSVVRYLCGFYFELSRKQSKSEPQATYGAENGGVDFKPSAPPKKIVSVLPALCKTFAADFFFGALLKLVQDLLAFVSPQILR